ncbi:MAG: tRNA (adenosine(37)-N6)-threonylcarbamoyltransferase complex ATPase subunit type 1 TsaE [Rhodospirillaceae bacterium]
MPHITPISLILPDEAATERLAASLAPLLRSGDVLTLKGDLGAGKTALARALIRCLADNPDEEVPSPTFTLVQGYETVAGPVRHFDLYRLSGPDDVIELGWDDALVESIVLVEWPDRLGSALPPGRLEITLTPAPEEGGAEARRVTLTAHGDRAACLALLAGSACAPLAGDASTRSYQRVIRPDGPPLIVMRAPHPETELLPFIRIAELLRPCGLSVPDIIAADPANGLLVLEDFGDETFAAALDAGAEPEPFYRLATEVLITLHRTFRLGPACAGLPDYDGARFLEQVLLLPELVFPADSTIRSEFETAWQAVIPGAMSGPHSLLLRDYHAGNLMLLAERPGVRRCGLLDFQDAGPGPAAYDLVSLVEDARRDIAPTLADAMIEHYLAAFPALDPVAFRQACRVLGAIRHTRVIAVFLRLAARGKPGYLRHLPRVWAYLDRHLARPELAPVAAWFARYLPPERRADLIISEPKS